MLECMREVFDRPAAPASPDVDMKLLHAKIGELTLENDFLEGALTKAGLLSAKRRLIDAITREMDPDFWTAA